MLKLKAQCLPYVLRVITFCSWFYSHRILCFSCGFLEQQRSYPRGSINEISFYWCSCFMWSIGSDPKQLAYSLTYSLHGVAVLLEKLICSQPVKKFPAMYGTCRFITAFKSSRHLSLSWASSIHSIPHIPLPEHPLLYCPPIYAWVFQVVSFPQVSPSNPCIVIPRLTSDPANEFFG